MFGCKVVFLGLPLPPKVLKAVCTFPKLEGSFPKEEYFPLDSGRLFFLREVTGISVVGEL